MFGPSYRLIKIFTLVLVTLAFYAVARTEFLLWNWNLFKAKPVAELIWAFIVGVRFDISAILTLTAPLTLLAFVPWPQKWNRGWMLLSWAVFNILHIPFLILNLVDTEFINFVGRRFSFDSLFLANELSGKIWDFVGTYWHLFLANTIIVGLFLFVTAKVVLHVPSLNWKGSAKLWGGHAFLCFVAIAISVVGIRGGVQNKPMSFVNANVFTAPLLNNLVLNSTFTFIKTYGRQGVAQEKYFENKDEMLKYLNGSLQGSLIEGRRPNKPQNIMIIVLESFGSEYLGANTDGKSYTPFLDSLMQKSLVFENSYANGRRSIEGIGAIMAGIPALMNEPFISSHFTANYFLGLGTLLAPLKYDTSFFHGGRNGTMFFDAFMQSAGVERYFGATEYANSKDDDGVWGIWDEPFLQWMLTKLEATPQPFMTSVFTLSSHHPFRVPSQYEDQFKGGSIPILKSVQYTDFALKKFFEEAEKKAWFKDTLFIVTADHTSVHYKPEYENEIGNYHVPLFFYHPGQELPKVDKSMIVQHIDILPTVLDYLNIPEKEKNYLGSSIFVPGDKVVVNFIGGHYYLFANDYFLMFTPGQGAAKMFAISDRNATAELKDLSPVQQERKQLLENKLKAQIQYFNEGMWDNKLYYPR